MVSQKLGEVPDAGFEPLSEVNVWEFRLGKETCLRDMAHERCAPPQNSAANLLKGKLLMDGPFLALKLRFAAVGLAAGGAASFGSNRSTCRLQPGPQQREYSER